MHICESSLARPLTDVLEILAGSRRVVLKFTRGRQKGTGRLRVVRCTGGVGDELVLTVAVEGRGLLDV